MITLYNTFKKVSHGVSKHFRFLMPGEIVQAGDYACPIHPIEKNVIRVLVDMKRWIVAGPHLSDVVHCFVPALKFGFVVDNKTDVYVRMDPDGEAYNTFSVKHLGDTCIFRVLRDFETIGPDDLQSLISPDGGKFDHAHRVRVINWIRSVGEDNELTGYHHPFYPVNGHTGSAGDHKGRIFIRLVAKQFFTPEIPDGL